MSDHWINCRWILISATVLMVFVAYQVDFEHFHTDTVLLMLGLMVLSFLNGYMIGMLRGDR
jgi:hypothetical protein